MRKNLFYILALLSLLIISLTGCSDRLEHADIKHALEAEGLQVEYTDNVEEGSYEFVINDKALLRMRVLDDAKEVTKVKQNLQQNAQEKQYEVEIFEVKHLLIAYYPPEVEDEELERKIRTAISKIAE